MTDDRRNKLAAVIAEGDQNNAHYRAWLQSLTQEQLDAMYEVTRGLLSIVEDTPTSEHKLAAMGVVALAKHALCNELTRRAEIAVGGEG